MGPPLRRRLPPCSGPGNGAPGLAHPVSIWRVPVVDAHAHLFAPEQRDRRAVLAERDATFAELYGDPAAKMATAPELLAAMDDAGIERAVVAGFAFADAEECAAQGRAILEAAGEAGGRIIPLATVNPAAPGWRAAAEGAIAAGARGFGELRPWNQGWDPLGPQGHTLADLAEATGTVLLWHVSEPVGHRYPGKAGGITAVELCELAEAHPRARMVAAHLGGGLSFYLEMPEVRASLANVWFDTAAVSLLYDTGSVARLADLAGPERVLFGSDYPLLSPRRQLQRLKASLPGEFALAVCGGNATTLFSESHQP